MPHHLLERWTVEHSRELYGIRRWSESFFDINEAGEVVINPGDSGIPQISIYQLVKSLRERGLKPPVLLRISDILDAKIRHIHTTFRKTIKELGYQGQFRGVYPIKVNQQQHVVQQIAQTGEQFCHGLEAGSKPELLAAISMLNNPEACLICNGYKDREFIEMGLYARRLGINCIFVIETLGELDLIFETSRRLNIEPVLGIRLKPTTRAGGQWGESGGDRSVFGLNTSEIIQVVDQLKEWGVLSWLKLLHYHIGSQIPNIRDIRSGVQEASWIYRGLVQEGAPMEYLDLGGGLAVDYDGSRSNFACSRNYSLEEYCSDIVYTVMETLDDAGIPHPHIITESGRAIVAYYSVLIFDILDVASVQWSEIPETLPENTVQPVLDLKETFENLSSKNIQECFNDALFYKQELAALFRHGRVSLRERALGEKIFWNIMLKIQGILKKSRFVPEELVDLDRAMADIYYGNFSLFQSLPDVWAVDQLFPILPLHRLDEKPDRNVILSDITCDCDGKIDRFIDLHDVKHTLPLHEVKPNEPYYLGVFLVGAYQETLGDLHNLLGDTNVVSICFSKDDEDGYEVISEIEGDSNAEVLSYVEYDTRQMLERLRNRAELAVRQKRITPSERRQILNYLRQAFSGYPYYDSQPDD
ncbi:MAG: biosynthetic arginine decarboxylase [Lentisphaerae bacterium]|nr:MAG: biosynthetic arginine decarboxylase [Lentisphaerota bacterium]